VIIKEIVGPAIVELPALQGRGVLVPGGYILTAAHCVEWSTDGGMALEDPPPQQIRTYDGRLLLTCPVAVEPVADIAVLGSVDDQRFPDEAESWQRFVEDTQPVSLATVELACGREFGVMLVSHDGKWLTAKATMLTPQATTIWVESEVPIEGGASGGPIVDTDGRLVGIVSNSSFDPSSPDARPSTGTHPRPTLTLPVWAANLIATTAD